MKLTRNTFDARVKVGSGPVPLVLSFGIVSFRATVDEARQLALALWEAAETADPPTPSDQQASIRKDIP